MGRRTDKRQCPGLGSCTRRSFFEHKGTYSWPVDTGRVGVPPNLKDRKDARGGGISLINRRAKDSVRMEP